MFPQPAGKEAWDALRLDEKLQAILSEAGAQAPEGVSLTEFTSYGLMAFHDVPPDTVSKIVAGLSSGNPEALLVESTAPTDPVRQFMV